MDIEAGIIRYLNERGFDAHADVPVPRPERLVTVERDGGTLRDVVRDSATVALQCWAPTRAEAAELAYEVRAAMELLPYERGFCSCAVNSGPYNYPAEKGEPRYQIVYDVVARADARQ